MYKNIFGGIDMKEEYKKWGIYAVISAAVIFIVSFVVSFFITRTENEDDYIDMPVNYVSEEENPYQPEITDLNTSYYLIKEQSGNIKLHYIEGENSTELKSEQISLDVFPKEDISMLTQGIRTETAEEALAVWENFIS